MVFGYTPNPGFKAILARANQAGLFRVALGLQKTIKAKLNQSASNIGNGGRPSAPGSPPARNTGTLARSIQIDASDKNSLKVGTNIIYAKIQEFGGVIRAKRVKFIPVPVNVQAKRISAANPRGLKNVPNLVVIKTKKQALLVQIKSKGRGKNRRDVWGAVWVLKGSVRLPKRPYMAPALAEYKPQSTTDYAAGYRAGLRSA
jgi:phage gpG-like protein